jgi:hypothetical protein
MEYHLPEKRSLAEQFMFTTVRIDTSYSDGDVGSGTGFIYHVLIDKVPYHFVVTNRHVVEGVDVGTFTFLEGKPTYPELGSQIPLEIKDFESIWHFSAEEDLAITPLAPLQSMAQGQFGKQISHYSVPESHIPGVKDVSQFNAIEDVIFIGYPNGVWDEANSIPVIRKGITSSPIYIDFDNKRRFLIDASVFGGSSGSPVFIYKNGVVTIGSSFEMKEVAFFVGVVSEVFYKTEYASLSSAPIPVKHKQKQTVEMQEMIDLGVVIKSSEVQKLVKEVILNNK